MQGVSLHARTAETATREWSREMRPSSDSLEFAGLAVALGTIFSQEKIATILSKLPPKCKIFGYDIGEYSGDDGMDVVLSAMRDGAARKTLEIYFFLNDGPGFRLLRTLERRYMLEPIEVGFAVEAGTCFVTEKTGEFAWRITGYSASGGTFRRVSEWTTDRMRTGGRETNVGYERSFSYETLLAEEHYYGSNSNRTFIRQKFYDLPVYPAELSLPRWNEGADRRFLRIDDRERRKFMVRSGRLQPFLLGPLRQQYGRFPRARTRRPSAVSCDGRFLRSSRPPFRSEQAEQNPS